MTAVLEYDAGFPIYALGFSSQPTVAGPSKASVASPTGASYSLPSRLALGSYIEGYAPNNVTIVTPNNAGSRAGAEPDHDWSYADDGGDMQMRRSPSSQGRSPYYAGSQRGQPAFVEIAQEPHPYPCTNVAFAPARLASTLQAQASSQNAARDMVATTSECLRLFDLVNDGPSWRLQSRAALATSKSEYPAPLTSFSWSTVEPSLIVSSSVDTTCTIWDIQAGSAITQLIAHDREVYDVSWSPTSRDVFASVGADGSVRMFDIRSLEHSTILYEVSGALSGSTALLRLAFNPADENSLAIAHADSSDVFLLDVRKPSVPVAQLHAHRAPVNAFAWDAHSALATASDDCQVLVWDLSQASGNLTGATSNGGNGSRTSSGAGKVIRQPSLVHSANAEINNVAFGSGDWIGAAMGSVARCLKV